MEIKQSELEKILPYNSCQLCDAINDCLLQEIDNIKRIFTSPVREQQIKEMVQAIDLVNGVKRLSIKVRKDTTFHANRQNKGNLA